VGHVKENRGRRLNPGQGSNRDDDGGQSPPKNDIDISGDVDNNVCVFFYRRLGCKSHSFLKIYFIIFKICPFKLT
jgi:hypothetical protein